MAGNGIAPGTVAAVERTIRFWFLAVVAVVVPLVGSSCSSDDGAEPPATAEPGAASLVGPDDFAARVAEAEVVTINVHVPDEGSIAGTDLSIAFDEISGSAALPDDRDTPLAVYCRSGNMSADAVTDLVSMGYTDVVELEGGFDAWVDSGRALEPPAG